MAKSITLLIPGLLDNLPDPAPRLLALETLLARADCRTDVPVGFERTLMHLFSQPQSPDHDVPEGALSRYAQTGEKPEGVWLCAAPVHLFADQSRVYLNAIDESALSESEASQLITELNKVYQEDGWEFLQHTSIRWYLRIPNEPSIRTAPLHDVDGKPIHDKLPQGEDALQWHRILNEMQMLLHSSSVNQAREERGDISVNGVWLWGMGELPDVVTSQWNSVWTNLPLAQGLSRLNGIVSSDLPPEPEKCWLQKEMGEQLLIILPSASNYGTEALRRLELNWFVPLIASVKEGVIGNLVFDCANGRRWRLSSHALRRFWRRRRCLSRVIE